MRKRILSLLASLCLIVALLPMAAYAEGEAEAAIDETNYGTLQEAIDGAQDGDMIRVLRDISLTKDALVTIAPDTPKEITIDLNQKTISYPNDGEWDTAALTISKPITLNIKNGKIDVGDDDHTAIKITCAEETPVDLTLSGVTIQAGYAAIYTDIANAAGKNRIMLENVDITSNEYGVKASDADIMFKSGSIHTTNDETFSLSRCSLTIDDGEFITTDDTCMDLGDEDTVVINGGYFKSGDDNALYLGSDSKATINGGIFEAPDKAIDADAENVTLGENLKTVLQDGTTLEDFLNSTYVSVVKTTATVTFISDGQKVAEVLVRKGQSISGDDLTDQSMPADPTKDRYIFKGWWTGENGTGEAFTGDSIVNGDLTVYAMYKRHTHSGGSAGSSGTLDLIKTDATDKNTYLPGAKFEIYDSNGKLVGTYSTDEKGQIKVPGLASGKYYAVETIPPKGYLQDGAKHEFTISGGKVTTLVLTGTRTGVPDMLNGDDHFAYIIGRSDGLVHPDAPITRAEVTTIFFRLLDPAVRDANLSYTNTFSDVNADLWCNTAISTMTKLGIVHGRTASTFDPDAFITRAEFAAIAARFDKSSVSQLANFSDISGHWAALEISKAAANGWVNGYSDGTFKPDRNITRAEAMALINRVLNRVPETVNDLLPDMVTWPDNMNTSAWCYLDVQEATNSHDYERKSNGCETWTKLTKVPDWKIYEN